VTESREPPPASDVDRSRVAERMVEEVMHADARALDGTARPWDRATEFVFGEVWTRPGLSRRDRRWITLACVSSAAPGQHLDSHVYGALKSGDISLDEMREFVLHFGAYAGFPQARPLNAVIDEQWARVERERTAASSSGPG
jgi:4-carboxymuconolactone decarboxylase